MTWRQIRTRDDKNHPIEPDTITPDACDRLTAYKRDDYDELWRLRFNKRERLWGLRIGPVFYVLWWDPQHMIA